MSADYADDDPIEAAEQAAQQWVEDQALDKQAADALAELREWMAMFAAAYLEGVQTEPFELAAGQVLNSQPLRVLRRMVWLMAWEGSPRPDREAKWRLAELRGAKCVRDLQEAAMNSWSEGYQRPGRHRA